MSAVVLESVSVNRGGITVLRDLSLRVEPGSWCALIGPNGAGKTTALAAIAGLVSSTGRIAIAGDEAATLSRPERARRVALVPQSPLIPAYVTVADYVLLGRTPFLSTFGRESSADTRAAAQMLTRLDLAALAPRRVDTLSGGELQRAVIARALCQGATVLLLDEPTSALDIGHQQQVLDLVVELRDERSLTVIAAMHDLTLASQYADQLLLLAEGRTVTAGTPAEVLTQQIIEEHYGASIRVIDTGDGGVAVVPVRRRAVSSERIS